VAVRRGVDGVGTPAVPLAAPLTLSESPSRTLGLSVCAPPVSRETVRAICNGRAAGRPVTSKGRIEKGCAVVPWRA